MRFFLSTIRTRIVRFVDEILISNKNNRSRPGLLLLCLAAASCDQRAVSTRTTSTTCANFSPILYPLNVCILPGNVIFTSSHFKPETSRRSIILSRNCIYKSCHTGSSNGMNVKVAKTKIVMHDGFPCYRLKVELENLGRAHSQLSKQSLILILIVLLSCFFRFLSSDSSVLKVMELRDLRKNLTAEYPFGGPVRVVVPDDKIEWSTNWAEYNPPEFTTPSILKGDKEWADKELRLTDVGLWPKWNLQDGGINRRSHHGHYRTDADGYPLNPAGRTGIKGRGSLGRWATNHAADCLVTRWKTENGEVVKIEGRAVLQFIGIIRKDTGDAAFPGGMVDAGEDALTAAKREFLEEVLSSEEASEEEVAHFEESLRSLFSSGETVYKGYVDDRRNTDNAWIETEAINFSLSEGDDVFGNLKFKAGSDASGALWIDIDQNVKLYASHKSIIQILVQKLDAYW